MDIEYSGKDVDTGIGTIDSIDVIVPPGVMAIIDNIKNTRLAAQKAVQQKKAEFKKSKPGQRNRLQEDIDKMNDALEGCFDEVKLSYLQEAEAKKQALNDTHGDYLLMQNNVNSVIFAKNQDFNLKIEEDLDKFWIENKYRYNILFLEFQSNNVTEMNEVEYNPHISRCTGEIKELRKNRHHLIINDCTEIDPIIEKLDTKLSDLLTKFDKYHIHGEMGRTGLHWIVIYFEIQFFLSDLALEKMIKFIDECHYKPIFKFALIFKKIEDSTIYPAGNKTQIRFSTYERKSNLLHDFLHKWFKMDQGKRYGAVMSRELVSNLLDQAETYKNHIRGTAASILQLYKVHNALHPREILVDKSKDDLEERRDRYLRSIDFIEKIIDYCYLNEPERQEKELYEIATYFYADRIEKRLESLIGQMSNYRIDKQSMIDVCILIKQFYALTHKTQNLSDAVKQMEKIVSEQEKKIRAEKDKPMEKRHLLRKNVKPKDLKDRADILTAKQQNVENSEEINLYNDFKESIVQAIHNFMQSSIDEYIWYIRKYTPYLLVDDYDKLVSFTEPDIQGNYMAELAQTKSARTESTMPNPAEIATRILFEIIALEYQKFYVSSLQIQFEARMNHLNLKLESGMLKHLFYFSLNLLKRSGMIHEQNKVKQVLHKCFHRRAVVDQGQM